MVGHGSYEKRYIIKVNKGNMLGDARKVDQWIMARNVCGMLLGRPVLPEEWR